MFAEHDHLALPERFQVAGKVGLGMMNIESNHSLKIDYKLN
jgi:hypothetical protein